jgi:hypothetical protein
MELPLIKRRRRLSMTQSVIDKYYVYHWFGLKAFEGRHIRIYYHYLYEQHHLSLFQ